jgi:hypothetical protein
MLHRCAAHLNPARPNRLPARSQHKCRASPSGGARQRRLASSLGERMRFRPPAPRGAARGVPSPDEAGRPAGWLAGQRGRPLHALTPIRAHGHPALGLTAPHLSETQQEKLPLESSHPLPSAAGCTCAAWAGSARAAAHASAGADPLPGSDARGACGLSRDAGRCAAAATTARARSVAVLRLHRRGALSLSRGAAPRPRLAHTAQM